ncbi:hypothetical protein DSO57_1023006 [Entomophthora muscae]|uniref:Uncharacterized protein n=1 Tax=Entomophthora muscae TaxID=34485 RepID=A0ACC2SRW8_9FUNG|nr:hypothetical protein DSO57_1023006 [Entomophthora muscae]
MRRIKKLLSSQFTEKTQTASSKTLSPTIDPDPTKELPDEGASLMDPDVSPEHYLPDKEKVNKDLLHQFLALNTVTTRHTIYTEALPSCEAVETVSIPYTKQLLYPSSKVTHESNSIKNLAQISRSLQVSTTLETLKTLKLELNSALEAFLLKFKGLDIHKVTKNSPLQIMEINIIVPTLKFLVHKLRVQAILDLEAPGNIVSTSLLKKLKLALALDLDYDEEFGTTSPDKT